MIWKNLKVFLVVLALLIALPLSLADDNETNEDDVINGNDVDDVENNESDTDADEAEVVDDEADDELDEVADDVELAPFNTNDGATVRLLQLERSIQKNILQGEMLLERLADRLSEESLEDLEAILLVMEDLKSKVSSYELVGKEEDVRAFVEFRHEASELSKEFRETLREFVQEQERNDLRAQVNKEVHELPNLARYDDALRERARIHNEEIVRASGRDVISEDLLSRIRSGEVEPKQIKEEVLSSVRNIRAEQANDVLRDMQEEALRQRMNIMQEQERVRNQVSSENGERVKEKINEMKERVPEDLQQRIDSRLSNIAQRPSGVVNNSVRGE
ncbi:hypothetical protein KO361_00220 [Candidatus Woesearchaeota archaeon]|nr:hypothetical protein [Candidatus Woesearchaeota archaeon]